MDIIAHFLLTIIIFGWDPFAIIGGILPDILYLLAFIKTKGREFKTTKLFVYGERMHSFFPLTLNGYGNIWDIKIVFSDNFYPLGFPPYIT